MTAIFLITTSTFRYECSMHNPLGTDSQSSLLTVGDGSGDGNGSNEDDDRGGGSYVTLIAAVAAAVCVVSACLVCAAVAICRVRGRRKRRREFLRQQVSNKTAVVSNQICQTNACLSKFFRQKKKQQLAEVGHATAPKRRPSRTDPAGASMTAAPEGEGEPAEEAQFDIHEHVSRGLMRSASSSAGQKGELGGLLSTGEWLDKMKEEPVSTLVVKIDMEELDVRYSTHTSITRPCRPSTY